MLPVVDDPTRGRYILETATALARRAEVRVYFQVNRPPFGRALAKVLDRAPGSDTAIEVESLTYPALPWLTRLVNGTVSSVALTPRLRRYRPDLILGYWLYPDGYAAVKTARALGIPAVVGALGSDIYGRQGLAAHLTRWTIRHADALLTVSEAMRRVAIDGFGADPRRVRTIVNGINTRAFHVRDQQATRARLGREPNERLIVYVGRLVESKGLVELVDAFRRLARRDPRYRLAIVGQGPMKEQLVALAAEDGLAGRIALPGGLPHEAVAEWISASDLLVLPSWSEGYPNVLVEAHACGRPVVATDVGGTREIVDASNGILIPPRDHEVLERALDAALARDWNHAAIAAAASRTWDDVASETLEACCAVLNDRQRQTIPGPVTALPLTGAETADLRVARTPVDR